MKETECTLFKLVKKAQGGDQSALWTIIKRFYPAIKKLRRKTNIQDQDDLEQEIIEKMIRAILTFDLNTPVDQTNLRKSIQYFRNKDPGSNNKYP
ncbi:helix-turn-helix domain-containing protein [Paenibacillus tyrfis]|uniref:helix-turn-helix domain-containing protein n=1 Tax=Paenibacillus tyrfis TaxID=1501230 RepID=UPI00068B7F09|nr:helix-turn-helix domain-containing protein [Paenibacillus tyrfis]